jgi:predicted permease
MAGLVTGLLPAWQATRTELSEALRSGGRSIAGGRSRTRLGLLVGQAALSVVLLVGAGLFVRSLRQAEALDLGFDADRLLVVALEWNETLPGEERRAIYEDVLTRVRRLPDVRAAGLSYTVPFQSSISLGRPRVPGLDSVPRHHNGGPYVNKVGPGYFEAMGLTLLRGRGIEATDDAEGAPPVAVVSESMADAYWPAAGALGACMIFDDNELVEPPCTEVVGVVENHRRESLVEDDPHFIYYVNQGHYAFEGPPQAIMIGAGGDPEALLPLVRSEARSASSQVRFVEAAAMSDLVEPDLRSWRLGASMFTVFGVLALIVAAWGLYSVLAFDVALRYHELGVRAALGADRGRIVRLVLRQALALVAVGTALGLLGAAGAARFVEPLLFRVSGTDPATYAAVGATLFMVATLAGSLPAWRATRVDPREALQAE